MSITRKFYAAALTVTLSILPAVSSAGASVAAVPTASAQQQQYGALERGWRTGYSDGYQVGWGDSAARRASDYGSKEDYRRADRAYAPSFGSLDDYRDGYRQGFESGYGDGYAGRSFSSDLPQGGVKRRGAPTLETSAGNETQRSGRTETTAARTSAPDVERESSDGERGGVRPASSVSSIPSDTIMRVELLNRLSTDVSQRGDRFEARVIEPREFEGATVAGRVAEVGRAGKVRGRAQLQLDFDQIRLPNGDWTDFHAQIIEVVPMGDEEIGEVDPEGGVHGRSTTKDDVAKVGAATGVGAILGAITGGGKGAAIGAIIGAGVGTGGVMTQRGKDLRFERGQQLRIRTSGETSMN